MTYCKEFSALLDPYIDGELSPEEFAAADRLKKMLHAVFPGAQVDVSPCGGLCSYYAELGGLMVGYEDNEAPAL